jgi:hypothetical protein
MAQISLAVRHAVTRNERVRAQHLGLVNGLMALWVYCGIRPRFGAGLNTAFKAAIVVWVIGSLIPNLAFMVLGGVLSHQLAAYVTLGAFIQCVVGVISGAAVYKEQAA